MSFKVCIIGIGKSLPGEPITNQMILQSLNLPEEVTEKFVKSKIKINTRHVARKLPEYNNI